MNKALLLAVAATSVIGSAAAEPGDTVVVLYNKRVPESKSVALHYADVRKVPSNQVFGLELPSTEAMSRAEFRTQSNNRCWMNSLRGS